LAWLVVLIVLIWGVRNRRKNRIVPAGALAIASLYLAHSFIDFSAQIPGYAIVVFAVVGAGLAQSFSSSTAKTTAELGREKPNSTGKKETGSGKHADNLEHARLAT
jgi:hypothetical protein